MVNNCLPQLAPEVSSLAAHVVDGSVQTIASILDSHLKYNIFVQHPGDYIFGWVVHNMFLLDYKDAKFSPTVGI